MKEDKEKYILKRGLSGLGLFAARRIKKGEFVIEYIGKKLTPEEFDKSPDKKYFFEIDDYWTVDGSGRDNTARYINHACRPNCEVRIYAKRIRIWAIKNIKEGEEFTYDYGKEYFNEYIKPKGCRCKSCMKKKAKASP
ncbi:MAG: SET domain-containing protein [Candidatus Moranbacteria bacterium]|nr:SET domain-containing protein [Candidatus Moranbacteria bacterium]